MKNIPNSITNRQMVFILFLTLTSITLITLPKITVVSAGNGFWVTILIGAVVFGLIAVLIVKLNMMFEGNVLYDYSRKIIGKTITYGISVFYILYFLTVSVFLCVSFADIVHYDFLLKTPQWGELLIGVPLVGYIAYKGVTNVARLFLIIGAFLLLMLLFVFFTMFFEGRIERILPLFTPSETGRYVAAVKETIVPFLGMEILTIVPFTKKNKGAAKTAFLTLIGIGMFYILATAGCAMMLGMNEIVHYNDALVEAFRLVQYPKIEFLQRVDILYLTFGFMGVFAGKAVVYMAIVEYLCRMFPKVKRIYPVLGTGVVVYFLSTFSAGIADIDVFFTSVISIAGIVAALIIPGLLFIIAKVRKHAGTVF